MLTNQSSFGAIRKAIDKTDSLYGEVLHNKGLRGKRERAMLHGQEWVHQSIMMGDQPVIIYCNVPSRSWFPVINIEGTFTIPNHTEENKRILMFLRRHAIERYVQRYIMHDEEYEVSEEEIKTYGNIIIEKMMFTSSTYDSVTKAWIMSIDGGAFLCLKHEEEHDGFILMQTFITVSMMKQNQSLANGDSMRASKARRRGITPDIMREMAKAQTLADFLNVYNK